MSWHSTSPSAQPMNQHPAVMSPQQVPSQVASQQPPTMRPPSQAFDGSPPAAQRPPTVPPPSQQPPQPTQTQPQHTPTMPRQQFERLLGGMLEEGKQIDPLMLKIDTTEIDLYELAVEVLKRGGFQVVNQHGLWQVIGAQLGWVQFPANGTEPDKASQQVASHLRGVYQAYLAQWESLTTTRMNQTQGIRQMHQHPNALAGGAGMGLPAQQQLQPKLTPQLPNGMQRPPQNPPFMSNPALVLQQQQPQVHQAQQQAQQGQQLQHQKTPQTILGQQPAQNAAAHHFNLHINIPLRQLLPFASLPAEELRRRGFPENTIQHIENIRPQLRGIIQRLQRHQMLQQSAQGPPGGFSPQG